MIVFGCFGMWILLMIVIVGMSILIGMIINKDFTEIDGGTTLAGAIIVMAILTLVISFIVTGFISFPEKYGYEKIVEIEEGDKE